METGAGDKVEGEVSVVENEHALNFTPLAPWTTGYLVLIANPALEDVAENNFRELLDHIAGWQEGDVSATALEIHVQNCSD